MMFGASQQAMLDEMKRKALLAKHTASTAAGAAGCVVKHGLDTMKDKLEVATGRPTVKLEDGVILRSPLLRCQQSSESSRNIIWEQSSAATVKEKLTTAGSAVKLGVCTVKGKCDAAKAAAAAKVDVGAVALKVAEAGSAVKIGVESVKDKCEYAAQQFSNSVDSVFDPTSGPENIRRRSAARAMALQMNQLERDEQEDMLLALTLSTFQAEHADAPQQNAFLDFGEVEVPADFWDDVPKPTPVYKEPISWHLKASVGTWHRPLRVGGSTICAEIAKVGMPELVVASDASPETTIELPVLPWFAEAKFPDEPTGIVSSRPGAVRCGA